MSPPFYDPDDLEEEDDFDEDFDDPDFLNEDETDPAYDGPRCAGCGCSELNPCAGGCPADDGYRQHGAGACLRAVRPTHWGPVLRPPSAGTQCDKRPAERNPLRAVLALIPAQPMTTLATYLDAVEAREKAASEGPWIVGRIPAETKDEMIAYVINCIEVSPDPSHFHVVGKEDWSVDVCHTGNGFVSPQNADLIAHARTDLPRLVQMLRLLVGTAEDSARLIGRCQSAIGNLKGMKRDFDTHNALTDDIRDTRMRVEQALADLARLAEGRP